ncbi:MAG: phage scaffolding protein [Oscillospiraceae bacterium]|jgi:Skp family chaperone for outer membrane proteins|nr:phage scaffolding protein [Oscillospiraceae bacterium]
MTFMEFIKSVLGDSLSSENEAKIKAEFPKFAVPKGEFNEKLDELKTAKTQLAERDAQLAEQDMQIAQRDTQIAELKKFEGTAAELQTKVAELTEQNKQKDDEKAQALATERKTNAMRLQLNGKVHDVDYVLGGIDTNAVTFDDGKLSDNFKTLVDAFTKDKPFVLVNPQTSANRGFKPVGTTPPDGAETAAVNNTPAVIGKKMAQKKIAQQKAAQTAANNYFGGN